MSTDDERGSWPKALIMVGLAFAAIMMDGFDLQSLGFVAPEIIREWHVDLARFGPVFSAALVGSTVGALGAGSVARILGLRYALVVALLTFGLCTLGLASISNGQFGSFATLRLIGGIGMGAAVPIATSLVSEHSPRRFKTRLTTFALCGQPLGAIGGAALCAHFIPRLGWAFAFYLGGIGPLVLALILMAATAFRSRAVGAGPVSDASTATAAAAIEVQQPSPPGLAAHAGRAAGRFLNLFRQPWLALTLLLSGCVFCANFFLYLVLNYVPGWLREQGHSLQYSVGAVSAFNAGGILGSLLIAWLVDRNGWRKTLPPVFVAAAVCLALLEPSRSFDGMLLPVIVLCGFLGYGGAVNFGPLILSVFPAPLRTQAVGCALGLGRLGGAIGPLLASLALSAGAPVGRLFYGAALAALLIVLNLTLLPSRQRTALSVAQ